VGTKLYDVMIVGGGGAGLTAALYASRAKLETLLFEKLIPGGQIATTDLVENYPGFVDGILGPEIAQKMEAQAKRYGTQFAYEAAAGIKQTGTVFEVQTAEGVYAGRTVILAMGASYRTLGVPKEKELTGKGVSYCATCDGAFFKEKEVIVVGGGDSALQEGIFLTRFASRVTVVHRRDKLRASVILQERANANPKISFIWDTIIDKIEGNNRVEAVLLKNVKTARTETLRTDGVFVFIGHDPNTELVRGFLDLDAKGYVLADELLQTSIPGVFAAGEVRKGSTRQLITACGEGCEAALAAQKYLEN